jgi:hypothetical protein
MKKANIIYGIYILCILTITIYLSIQIIEGNFKEFAFAHKYAENIFKYLFQTI